jgi:porphobilinogen synthase
VFKTYKILLQKWSEIKMGFPQTRFRRLRVNKTMRRMVAETRLSVDELVYPMFVCPGRQTKAPIKAMDNCFRLSPDLAAKEASKIAALGIPAVLLFGTGEKKDAVGSRAWAADSAVCRAIDKIKSKTPDLLVITDVCLCAYTSHGHCGLVTPANCHSRAGGNPETQEKKLDSGFRRNDKKAFAKIDNDSTLEILAQMALAHARAGADIIAPSDMMDGRVGVIREALDDDGLVETAIMSYSAKFASAFYGPFRDAAQSVPSFGDRRTHQIDPACARQAIRQIQADIEQGADIVMIKPALPYLDIIAEARRRFDVPIAAYNVSGEYMMLRTAAKAGLLDLQNAMTESLLSIKRAGADIIITYFAPDIAKILNA